MINITIKKYLELYVTDKGKQPFIEWLESLKDKSIRYRIALGNMGDVKSVGEGVMEVRLAFGPGYRIYYGEDKGSIVLLLCGGDKSSQVKDIKKAKIYWQDI
jgi:putative addiction module killer protein